VEIFVARSSCRKDGTAAHGIRRASRINVFSLVHVNISARNLNIVATMPGDS
jgi:hypothetical protein